MRVLKQSTAYSLVIFMTDSADHVSGKTGLTLTITASKAGAAFASITPTVTELSNGWYKLALTSSHTDTLGDFALHITATGADPTDVSMAVAARINDDFAYPATSGRSLAVDTSGRIDLGSWLGSAPNALQSGRVDSYLGAVASGVIAAGSFAANALDAVWSTATRVLTAGTNIVLAKGVGLTGLNDLSTSDVDTTVQSALTTQGYTTTRAGKLDNLDRAITAIMTTAMTESYSADGATATPAQAMYAILQRLTDFSIVGTSLTVKKLDGSTTAFTLTLDDATAPTSSTRSS